MVRVLSTGELVADDDPRVKGNQPTNRPDATQPRQRMGFLQHDEHQPQQGMGQVSVFDNLNQRLLDMGLPRWNLWIYPVEPLVSVGFLLAFFLIGLHGLLFALLLFGVVKWSQRGEPADGNNVAGDNFRGPPPAQDGWPQRGGYRLGR